MLRKSLYQLTLLLLFVEKALAIEPEIHSLSYPSGIKFHHFELQLTAKNLLLPQDFANRAQLDEHADNFQYGQFEIFIPTAQLKLPQNCQTNYIARMPQTLDLTQQTAIDKKQQLFFRLKDIYSGKEKPITVVFETPYSQGCNIFFRHYRGQYIDYIGPLKTEDRQNR